MAGVSDPMGGRVYEDSGFPTPRGSENQSVPIYPRRQRQLLVIKLLAQE